MNKTVALFVTIISLSLTSITFASTKSEDNTPFYGYNDYGEMFTFVERGITFSIFQNGEFDFYINPRNSVQAGINVGGVSISYNSGYDYDAYVQYDDYGAIIQIEDVPIYYDYYGRISQAGNVRIRYNGQRLVRVGGLHIFYDRFGNYSYYNGYINRFNRHYVFHPYHNYFVRPFYADCIVSFNPYRRYYSPIRYNYRTFRNNYYSNRNYRANRTFRNINSRVASSNSNRQYSRRSTVSRNVARNNSSARRQSTQRNSQLRRSTVQNNRTTQRRSNTSSRVRNNNTSVRRSASQRIVQSRSNRKPSSSRRVAQNTRSKPASTSQRRTVERRSTPTRNVQNRTVQRRSNQRVSKPTRNTSTRNTTQRTSRSGHYKKQAPRKTSVNRRSTNTSRGRIASRRK